MESNMIHFVGAQFTMDALPHILLILLAGLAYGWASHKFKLGCVNAALILALIAGSPFFLAIWSLGFFMSAFGTDISHTVYYFGPFVILAGSVLGHKIIRKIDKAKATS